MPHMEEGEYTEERSYPASSSLYLEDSASYSIESTVIREEDFGNQQHGTVVKDEKLPSFTNDLNDSTLEQGGTVHSEYKSGNELEVVKIDSSKPHNILTSPSRNEPKEIETQINGVSNIFNKDDVNRVLVDTATPFESVKEAVTKFGGLVDWKSQKELIVERRNHVQLELKEVHEKIPVYREQCEVAQAVKGRVLKELDYTKRLVEELRVGLEKAETQVAEAKQDSELAVRLKEMQQGIASNASVAAKAHLEVAKERQESAVAGLKSVKQELESMKRQYASLIQERDIAIKKAEESVSASKEIEKTVENLTMELITIKDLLEFAHSAHLEAEEQRIDAVLSFDQDKLNWEKELKQAEDELRQLNEQLLLTNDLQSKLDRASNLLVSLKAELSSCMEAKKNSDISSTQGLMAANQAGELVQTETSTQAALAATTKELEEARLNIEKANDEVNCLRVAVSSLKSELEKEKASLATLRQRENLASVSVSSLEAELNRINTELELIMAREKQAREKMVDLPKELQLAAEEADQAKSLANMAREELKKAKEEAAQAKAGAITMETRLNAVFKEIEAARASEKLAKLAVKALEESEQASMEPEGSSNGVTLPIDEYYRLSKKANEVEEIANNRVVSAIEQIKLARDSESKSLVKLEEANQMIEKKKKAQRAALEKAERTKEAKLGAQQELISWRTDQEQHRRVSNVARSLSDLSNLDESALSEAGATNESSVGSPGHYMQRSNAATVSFTKRRRSFFPRMVMFLARKKVQSVK